MHPLMSCVNIQTDRNTQATSDLQSFNKCRLISYIQPAQNETLLKALQEKKMTVLGNFSLLAGQIPKK